MVIFFVVVLGYLGYVLVVIFFWWCLFNRKFLGFVVVCIYWFVIFYCNLVICDFFFEDLDNVFDWNLGLIVKVWNWICFCLECYLVRYVDYVYVV